MKIGIFSTHVISWAKTNGLSISEASRRLAEYGICSLETDRSEWGDNLPSDWALRFAGLPVRCVHGVCSLCAEDDARFRAGLTEAYTLIDYAASLGAEFALIVPARPEDVDGEADRPRALRRMIEGLNLAAVYAKLHGVRVTIENFSVPCYPFTRPDDLAQVFASAPEVGYTLDTGNFLCAGLDVLEAVRMLPMPVLVHAKDWVYTDGQGFGNPPLDGAALGEGIIPLRALLDNLRAQGYDGDVMIEYNSYTPDDAKIERSAAFAQREIR